MKLQHQITIAFALAGAAACKPMGTMQESSDFSGLYTLSMNTGTSMSTAEAVSELDKLCGSGGLTNYLDRIAKKISFNAGYSNHPNAGWDAPIVQNADPEGGMSYFMGDGQGYSGEGSLAMLPPTNGSINKLVEGYCAVTLASLGGANRGTGCKYPSVTVSRGGVNGKSAAGSIGSTGCIVATLSNQQIRHKAEIAFCPDAIGANFITSGDGAAGEMSVIIRGGG